MDQIGNTSFENPFDVTVQLDDEHYYFQIIPSYHHDKQESEFLVLLSGVDSGTLKMDFNEGWQWSEGNLGKDFADAIGEKIDKYYGN